MDGSLQKCRHTEEPVSHHFTLKNWVYLISFHVILNTATLKTTRSNDVRGEVFPSNLIEKLKSARSQVSGARWVASNEAILASYNEMEALF